MELKDNPLYIKHQIKKMRKERQKLVREETRKENREMYKAIAKYSFIKVLFSGK